ncbi:MAG: hypothetical protein DRJ65_19400 [Acidobacteria bacterium]|nr:MAG: hypothetical protein DRJ65_19400 [Acidobacteriota bacterium]
MKAVRVGVFDRSPSIRALLKRTVEGADGLTCAESAPLSVLLEEGVDHDTFDKVVIGLAQGEEDTWSTLLANLTRTGQPAVILSPPGQSDPGPGAWPGQCLFLEKPRNPQGWRSFPSILISALGRVENRKCDPIETGRLPRLDLIAVGCSAGGPDATGEMLKTIGKALQKTAILVVQHIGEDFQAEYVQWLSRVLPWVDVDIGEHGEKLSPGRVRVAGQGAHFEVTESFALRLDRKAPPDHGHRPSVDRLFESVARSMPRGSAGVLLSGMGVDGVEGLLSLSQAGCLTLAQDRESSAVFGMPRAALERGAATIVQPPDALGRVLRDRIEAGRLR